MNLIYDKIKDHKGQWLIIFDEQNQTKQIIKLDYISESKHDELFVKGPEIIFFESGCNIKKESIRKIPLKVFCSSKNYSILPEDKIENYLNLIIWDKIKKDFLNLK